MMRKIMATIGVVIFIAYILVLILFFGGRLLGKDMDKYKGIYERWTWYAVGFLMGFGFLNEFG